jgi:hypothetical protein
MIGIAHAVSLKVGNWFGKITFLVVTLDDFDVILGNMFFCIGQGNTYAFSWWFVNSG